VPPYRCEYLFYARAIGRPTLIERKILFCGVCRQYLDTAISRIFDAGVTEHADTVAVFILAGPTCRPAARPADGSNQREKKSHAFLNAHAVTSL
jgi:hypothetical protein